MSKEYWAQVLEFESSSEMSDRYKHLEGLYKDYWHDRSMIAELNLNPKDSDSPPCKSSLQKVKLPTINNSKVHHRRLSSTDLPILITSVFGANEKPSKLIEKRRKPTNPRSKRSSLSRRVYF